MPSFKGFTLLKLLAAELTSFEAFDSAKYGATKAAKWPVFFPNL